MGYFLVSIWLVFFQPNIYRRNPGLIALLFLALTGSPLSLMLYFFAEKPKRKSISENEKKLLTVEFSRVKKN